MAIKIAVKKNAYHDSVTLMAISGQVKSRGRESPKRW